jgi:hypothetical protein
MALKVRELISTGSPDNQSSYMDQGENSPIAAATVTTAVVATPAQIVASTDLQLADGSYPGGTIAGGVAIQRLNGAQVNLLTLLAAATNFNFGVSVNRTAQLGAAITASVAITQVQFQYPLLSPMPSGQTFVVTNAAGNTQSFTSSAAVPAGSLIAPVNSVTPGNAYVVGNPVVFQVGAMACFGWLASGVGTPVFPAKATVPMPPILANTALVTPIGGTGSYLPLASGDRIEVLTNTASSTVTLPAGLLQLLVI